ncbi:hypothetical protein SGPA1_30906 [Streptomyces misionensis JCM 4497]
MRQAEERGGRPVLRLRRTRGRGAARDARGGGGRGGGLRSAADTPVHGGGAGRPGRDPAGAARGGHAAAAPGGRSGRAGRAALRVPDGSGRRGALGAPGATGARAAGNGGRAAPVAPYGAGRRRGHGGGGRRGGGFHAVLVPLAVPGRRGPGHQGERPGPAPAGPVGHTAPRRPRALPVGRALPAAVGAAERHVLAVALRAARDADREPCAVRGGLSHAFGDDRPAHHPGRCPGAAARGRRAPGRGPPVPAVAAEPLPGRLRRRLHPLRGERRAHLPAGAGRAGRSRGRVRAGDPGRPGGGDVGTLRRISPGAAGSCRPAGPPPGPG